MSFALSLPGGLSPVAPPMAALERCTNALMFLMTRSTSSFPDTCVVSTPATRSSPSSEASASHVRGFSPSERSEPPPAPRVDRPVGLAHLGGGLLVVHVLELHEGTVARWRGSRSGSSARRCCRSSARGRPTGACPCWCGRARWPGSSPAGPASRCPSAAGSRPPSGSRCGCRSGTPCRGGSRRHRCRSNSPQETRASAAKSAIRTRRRTRRRVLGPTATPRRCRRWRKDADYTSPDRDRDGAHGARAERRSAQAATVIEVNGDHAVRRFDPMVPPPSATDLPRPAGPVRPADRQGERSAATRGPGRAGARRPAGGP